MKKALVYVHSSKGELDWIVPFIKYSAGDFEYDLFIEMVGNTTDEKKGIIKDYRLDGVVNLVESKDVFNEKQFLLFKVVNRLRDYSRKITKGLGFHRRSLDFLFLYIINFIAYFSSVEKEKYSLIFRDYNLSDSLGLSVFLESNKEAKVIVYPHAVNVQQSFGRFPPLRRRCDLWLENTWLSDHAASRYKKQLFVCGIPALAHAQEIFSFESNTVLFLTRNCSKEFGFSLDEALPVFDFFLNELSNQGLKVLVKHHPRDKNLHSWRKVQKKYSCVDECNESLSEISFNVSFCLTLFSSAGLFLVGRGVPVFDVSPYKKKESYTVHLPYHYRVDEEGCITHELVNLGVYDSLKYNSGIELLASKSLIEEISIRQKNIFYEYFPIGSCDSILKKIKEVL